MHGRTVGSRRFQALIVALIVLNAATLGRETYVDGPLADAKGLLKAAEAGFVTAFAAELALKVVACGRRFFRAPWNRFDMAVVGASGLLRHGRAGRRNALVRSPENTEPFARSRAKGRETDSGVVRANARWTPAGPWALR